MSNKGKEIYPLDLIMKLIGGNHFIAVLRTEDKSPSVEDEKYIYIYFFKKSGYKGKEIYNSS